MKRFECSMANYRLMDRHGAPVASNYGILWPDQTAKEGYVAVRTEWAEEMTVGDLMKVGRRWHKILRVGPPMGVLEECERRGYKAAMVRKVWFDRSVAYS